jgi:hypothetical protein
VRGKFGALTTCYKSEPGINRKKIILLDARGDGKIKLSRTFVSVESVGTVNIVVEEQLCKCFKSSAGSQF